MKKWNSWKLLKKSSPNSTTTFAESTSAPSAPSGAEVNEAVTECPSNSNALLDAIFRNAPDAIKKKCNDNYWFCAMTAFNTVCLFMMTCILILANVAIFKIVIWSCDNTIKHISQFQGAVDWIEMGVACLTLLGFTVQSIAGTLTYFSLIRKLS